MTMPYLGEYQEEFAKAQAAKIQQEQEQKEIQQAETQPEPTPSQITITPSEYLDKRESELKSVIDNSKTTKKQIITAIDAGALPTDALQQYEDSLKDIEAKLNIITQAKEYEKSIVDLSEKAKEGGYTVVYENKEVDLTSEIVNKEYEKYNEYVKQLSGSISPYATHTPSGITVDIVSAVRTGVTDDVLKSWGHTETEIDKAKTYIKITDTTNLPQALRTGEIDMNLLEKARGYGIITPEIQIDIQAQAADIGIRQSSRDRLKEYINPETNDLDLLSAIAGGVDASVIRNAGYDVTQDKYGEIKFSIDKVKQEYEKVIRGRDESLNTLSLGGYRSYKDGQEVYDVGKYIRDNPTNEAVAVLRNAGFSGEVVDDAARYVKTINEFVAEIDSSVSAENVGETGKFGSINPNTLGRAMRALDIPPEGSFVVAWRELDNDKLKAQVAQVYLADPDERNIFATLAAEIESMTSKLKRDMAESSPITKNISMLGIGSAELITVAPLRLIDGTIEWHKNPENETVGVWSVSKYSPSYLGIKEQPSMPLAPTELAKGMAGAFVGAYKDVTSPDGWETGKLGKGIGEFTILLAPFAKTIKGTFKGVVTRAKPNALTSNAIALTTDVGRVELPKGMPQMAARQLIADVEAAQLIGKIPIERLASYADLRKGIPDSVKTIEVIRNKTKGTTDIVLKSGDGSVVGHISGLQRVVNDVVYHATGDTQAILKQIQEKGYFEVSATEGKHPFVYLSPQVAEQFMYRNPGSSPGIIAIRLTPEMWKELPKDVMDSPNVNIMRQKMFNMAEKGQLEEGIYPLNKGYGNPLNFEYEVVASPKTKFYPADATLYAPNKYGAPKTTFNTSVAYDGSAGGIPVGYGTSLPIYWLGTTEAIGKGLGVPSVIDMYAAKLLGDLTAIRKWMPYNLRLREKPSGEVSGVTSPNPLYSTYQQLKLKAAPEDTAGGRVSAVIYNEKGEVLLTRNQGAKHFDLPGGATGMGENLGRAVAREVFEETGLKPTYIEHIDTIKSTFTKGGEVSKFQIFEMEVKGNPVFGKEIAEYIWWDGKKKLKYDVAPFTETAINRIIERNSLLDTATVATVIDEAIKKAKEKGRGIEFELALTEELARISKEVDGSVIPYKGTIKTKVAALSVLSDTELTSRPSTNEVPITIKEAVGIDEYIIADNGVINPTNIVTATLPDYYRSSDYTTINKVPMAETLLVDAEKPLVEALSLDIEKPLYSESVDTTITEIDKSRKEITSPTKETGEVITKQGIVLPDVTKAEVSRGLLYTPFEAVSEYEMTGLDEKLDIIETIDSTELVKTGKPEPLIAYTTPQTTPKKTIDIAIATDESGNDVRVALVNGTRIWIQGRPYGGAMFKIQPPPYDKVYTSRINPPGYVDKGWKGEGMAVESMQIIGGKIISEEVPYDMGAVIVGSDDDFGTLDFRKDETETRKSRSVEEIYNTVGMVYPKEDDSFTEFEAPISKKKPKKTKIEPGLGENIYFGRKTLPDQYNGRVL